MKTALIFATLCALTLALPKESTSNKLKHVINPINVYNLTSILYYNYLSANAKTSRLFSQIATTFEEKC